MLESRECPGCLGLRQTDADGETPLALGASTGKQGKWQSESCTALSVCPLSYLGHDFHPHQVELRAATPHFSTVCVNVKLHSTLKQNARETERLDCLSHCPEAFCVVVLHLIIETNRSWLL